jgi:hypothetical protein
VLSVVCEKEKRTSSKQTPGKMVFFCMNP